MVSVSLDVTLSESTTDARPMENALPVTSVAVVNSARVRKPDDGKRTGEVTAKSVPVDCGTLKGNALFSVLTKVSRVASKSKRSCMPTKRVVTPVAKTSMAMVVPRPDTVPDVTPSFL